MYLVETWGPTALRDNKMSMRHCRASSACKFQTSMFSPAASSFAFQCPENTVVSNFPRTTDPQMWRTSGRPRPPRWTIRAACACALSPCSLAARRPRDRSPPRAHGWPARPPTPPACGLPHARARPAASLRRLRPLLAYSLARRLCRMHPGSPADGRLRSGQAPLGTQAP